MKKLIFNTANFWNCNTDIEVAKKANEIFDKWLKENIENAPMVYSDDKGGVWFDDMCKENSDTRKAKLVMIEEIK